MIAPPVILPPPFRAALTQLIPLARRSLQRGGSVDSIMSSHRLLYLAAMDGKAPEVNSNIPLTAPWGAPA